MFTIGSRRADMREQRGVVPAGRQIGDDGEPIAIVVYGHAREQRALRESRRLNNAHVFSSTAHPFLKQSSMKKTN